MNSPFDDDHETETSYFLTSLTEIIKAAANNTLILIPVEYEGTIAISLSSYQIDFTSNGEDLDLSIMPLALIPNAETWSKSTPITNIKDMSFHIDELPEQVQSTIKKRMKQFSTLKNFSPPVKGSIDEFGMEP